MPASPTRSSLSGLWLARRADILAIGLYLLLALLITYPTVMKLGTVIYGIGTGDSWAAIWRVWWLKYSWLNGVDHSFLSLSQAPFGTDYVFREYPAMDATLAVLAIAFGEVVAYNLMILAAFILSAAFTYLLAKQLTGNRMASFVAGLVFGFSSYMLLHAQLRVEQPQIWVIPLFMLALLNLQRKQTAMAALLTGGAYALAFYMQTYYSYHITIAALAFWVTETIVLWRTAGIESALSYSRLGHYLLAAVIGLGLCLPELYGVLQDLRNAPASPLRYGNVLQRDERWFFWLSSRPWYFVLPPQNHLLFGEFATRARQWVFKLDRLDFAPPVLAKKYPGLFRYWFWQTDTEGSSTEQFLGYANLAVAAYTLLLMRRGTAHNALVKTQTWPSLWLVYFVALFVVAILFSAPPYIPVGAFLRPIWEPLHNIVIPMPSLISMNFVRPLRYSSRFIAPAMLALAMLVAVGLNHLLQRIHTPAKRFALTPVFVGLLVFERLHVPVVTPLSTPPEHLWLAQQPPDTIVAVYPYGNSRQATFQRIHQLPVIDSLAFDANLNYDRLYEIERESIGSLDDSAVVSKLAALGVRYIVNADRPLEQPPEGLALEFSTDTAQVFEVTANPAPLVVLHTLRDGLWTSEATWGWQAGEYAVTVWNPLTKAVNVNIKLTLREAAAHPQLLAYRNLTPPPETVVRGGKLVSNPIMPPDYASEPVRATTTPDGLVFESLLIQPGETTLTLRWSESADMGAYPYVQAVQFTLPQKPGF